MNTRPAYTGPRTRFTAPDGTYRFVVSIDFRDLPSGDRECPALAHGMHRVREALGREDLTGLGGMAGAIWPRFASKPIASVAQIDGTFPASSDEEAREVFERLTEAVGSISGAVSYVQPTELGSTSGKEQRVALHGHAAEKERLGL